MISLTTQNNNTPHFGAKFIKSKEALRLSWNREYVPHTTNIIEMNHTSNEDSKAIMELYDSWRGAEFIGPITSKSHPESRKIYALTTQRDDFSHPDAQKILGIADLCIDENNAHLKFLQADSRILNCNFRTYKHIGQALAEGIAEHLEHKGMNFLKIFAIEKKKPFYKKVFPDIVEIEQDNKYFSNMVLDLKHQGRISTKAKGNSASQIFSTHQQFFG